MHNAIVNLGYAVLDLFSSVSGAGLMQVLKIVGVGMLGIFIVTGLIILVVMLLGKLIPSAK